MPCGAISGSSAAVAGLSKAPAVPSTKVAMKMWTSLSQPPSEPQARNSAVSGFRDLAELHHALALEAVGGLPGDKHQQRGRQKLHQPDHAEVEGAAGEIVDLPADRDRADLAREARQAPRQQEEDKGGLPEQRAGACGCEGRHA